LFKILLIGDSGVGKTSILSRLAVCLVERRREESEKRKKKK
jgi:GTPase SAR1 family protein